MSVLHLRAHSLLCIQGFVGKGYSPEFVDNMRRVVESLEPSTVVRVVTDPDALCAACPNLASDGCALHGRGTEESIQTQDHDVARRLGIEPDDVHSWRYICGRIAARIEPDDLDEICGHCPWLPLGVCKLGIEALRS